jgi:TrmH family RNA methyltransferase
MLSEAIASGARVLTILLREDGNTESEYPAGPGSIPHSDKTVGESETQMRTMLLSSDLFDKLSSTETPQNIMAEVEKPQLSLESAEAYVVLDRIQDPGNVGSIIRSAAAAGRYGMILLKGTADPFSDKVVRASAGAIFKVPICTGRKAKEALTKLKEENTPLIACSMDGEEIYHVANLKGKVAIVVGNEGSGLSDSLIDNSDVRVRIPMSDDSESLNAAIAVSILLFEKRRQDV